MIYLALYLFISILFEYFKRHIVTFFLLASALLIIRLRSSVSAFTTFIFSCWKRGWKVLRDFCTLSPSMQVCFIQHWRETATCITVSLPKLVNHQNFLKGFGLGIMSEPTDSLWTVMMFMQQLVNPGCCTNLDLGILGLFLYLLVRRRFFSVVLWHKDDSGLF